MFLIDLFLCALEMKLGDQASERNLSHAIH